MTDGKLLAAPPDAVVPDGKLLEEGLPGVELELDDGNPPADDEDDELEAVDELDEDELEDEELEDELDEEDGILLELLLEELEDDGMLGML